MQKYKIWIDEAGRWPWFWEVVASAFCFNPKNPPKKEFIKKLNDSKKISEKKRKEIFKEIIKMSETSPLTPLLKERGIKEQNPKVFFWVWVVDNFLIDKINIKEANKEAMRRAILEIKRKIWEENIWTDFKIDVFIDWKDNYNFEELEKKPIFIIGWDSKVPEISAASIIAKVFRDKLMKTYSSLYPSLWIEKHKWYGTKAHRDYLKNKSMITSFHRLSYKPVKEVLEKKPKLLLHICCWPDATIPIVDYKDKFEIICFWYDPNIHPKKEYDKRLAHFRKVCEIEKVEYIVWEYDTKKFFKKIAWLEHTPEKWEKCTKCYDMRLERSAFEAKKLGIKYFTTTLNISPHKDIQKIFSIWEKYSLKEKIEFLKIDFRKKDWFNRSVEYTKKHKIYRQNYCWCVFSETFPKK